MMVVTGGTGHIGNVLVRQLLQQGEVVRVIIPPQEDAKALQGLEVEIIRGDIRDLTALLPTFEGADVVYHLAGLISILPGQSELLHQVNVLGTRNVVDACIQTGVRRLVYTSSVHALEELPHGTVITENAAISPDKVQGDYARSKALATQIVLTAASNGLDAVVVHPSGVIGPYEYRLTKTSQLISRYLKSQTIWYTRGGYDFVDVRDVVDGLIRAATTGHTGENYILSGEWISVDNLLGTLRDITGLNPRCIRVPLWAASAVVPFADMYAKLSNTSPLLTAYSLYTLQSNSCFSHAKATAELGYAPRPMRETLTDTVAWLLQH